MKKNQYELGGTFMLASINGHYDGNQIIMEENIKMTAGQRVIITILDQIPENREKIDLDKYMGRGGKLLQTDAQDYVKELRDHDRI